MKNLILFLNYILFSNIDTLFKDHIKDQKINSYNKSHKINFSENKIPLTDTKVKERYNFIKWTNGDYYLEFSSLEEEFLYYKISLLLQESGFCLSEFAIRNLLHLEEINDDTVAEVVIREQDGLSYKKYQFSMISRILCCSLYHYVS